MQSLAILFAGKSVDVTYLGGQTHETLFVRALPQRYLGEVLAACEHPHRLVELCTYRKTETPSADAPSAGIRPPAGYEALPAGWTDNLTDESLDALHALATELNFSRAAKWGEGQIAAKKLVLPLYQKMMGEVEPMVDLLLKRLRASSPSTPSAPSSSVAGEKLS